jgi:hypothetical protein
MDATSGAGTDYPAEVIDFTPVFFVGFLLLNHSKTHSVFDIFQLKGTWFTHQTTPLQQHVRDIHFNVGVFMFDWCRR